MVTSFKLYALQYMSVFNDHSILKLNILYLDIICETFKYITIRIRLASIQFRISYKFTNYQNHIKFSTNDIVQNHHYKLVINILKWGAGYLIWPNCFYAQQVNFFFLWFSVVKSFLVDCKTYYYLTKCIKAFTINDKATKYQIIQTASAKTKL